jgi:hypothetical protein
MNSWSQDRKNRIGTETQRELHAIGRMNGLGAYVRTRDSFFNVTRMTYDEWIKAKQ